MNDVFPIFKTDCGIAVNANSMINSGFIGNGSVDMILTDLPYGKTKFKGDKKIPPEMLWPVIKRITKPNAAIVLFGQGDFTAEMIMSNKDDYRYTLVYEKTHSTGYLNANKMPLRCHEDMMVFYRKLPTYNPQKTKGHKRKVSTAHHKRNTLDLNYGDQCHVKDYDSTERYPRSVWRYKSDKQKNSRHPQQKPIKLLEDLIKTYTNNGELVVDLTAGSLSTAIAAINTEREFIVFEQITEYFLDGVEWIKNTIDGKGK